MRHGPNRRQMLAGALSSTALMVALPSAGAQSCELTQVSIDLGRYVGFGEKHSGGVGDNSCGDWLESELRSSSFIVERQSFTVPWFEADNVALMVGGITVPLLPLAMTVTTSPDGLRGRLVSIHSDTLAGAIAIIELPYARWSSVLAPIIRAALERARTKGAVAAIIVTTGPTTEAIALNVPADGPLVSIPVGILAPRNLPELRPWIGGEQSAKLIIVGRGGRRPAFNLIAKIDRGATKWLVVSTPRSGWTICGGERGPGLAAWLALSRWAIGAVPGLNLMFTCNSGHEYEYLGSEHSTQSTAPSTFATQLWLHLGANAAARDWHELGVGNLTPLPSADPQRYVMATPDLVEHAKIAFLGLPGLEQVYSSREGAPGELGTILAAGYRNVVGIYGGHRFHHVIGDDMRTLHPTLVLALIASCKQLISNGLSAARDRNMASFR